MGNKHVQSVFDLARWKLDLSVHCLSCGRFAAFDAQEVIASFTADGRPLGWPIVNQRFRCACRSRHVRIGFTDQRFRPSPLPPRRPLLQPIYVTPPKKTGPVR